MNRWQPIHACLQIGAALLVTLAGAMGLASCGGTPSPAATEAPPAQPVGTGSTPTPQPDEASRYGGTLVIQTSSLVQFDPIFVADDNSFQVISNVYSLLFRRQGPEIIPDLATSWEYVDDTTLLFHLRHGVRWHDDNEVFARGASREVVASDVVYSLERAMTTEGNTMPADLAASYASVEAVDDHTVKVTLQAPDALLFTTARGLSSLAIVPREAVEQLGEDFSQRPIGSGPFKFVEYKPDESLTLERNDLHWKRPYLDRILYRVIPDQDAAVIALEAGEIDVLGTVPDADFQRLQGDERFILYPRGCPAMVQLHFNMTDPLYGDLRFRQAVAYALDGDAINANVYGGMHISGCGTAGPGIPGYDPELCQYSPYDPQAARSILKDMGWNDTDGDGILDKDGQPMTFELEIWSTSPMPQFGAAIATQLQEVGIPVELQTVEFGTWIADWNAGVDKAMVMSGWCGDGGTNALWGREGMARAMGYDDPEIFRLLDEANTLVDPVQRDQVLQEAANRIYSQYWAISLGFHDSFQATRAGVHNFHATLWFQNLCTDANNVWVSR
jgi:peptide/nickel transport system substrate-binding protein